MDDLAKEGFPVAVGPSFGHASKYELRNKSFETPGILDKAGCRVSIITDAPVIPQQYLALCAGLAVKSGWRICCTSGDHNQSCQTSYDREESGKH